jgi:hypothetical protein
MTFIGDAKIFFTGIKMVKLQSSWAFAITTLFTLTTLILKGIYLEFFSKNIYIKFIFTLIGTKLSLFTRKSIFTTVPGTLHNG